MKISFENDSAEKHGRFWLLPNSFQGEEPGFHEEKRARDKKLWKYRLEVLIKKFMLKI